MYKIHKMFILLLNHLLYCKCKNNRAIRIYCARFLERLYKSFLDYRLAALIRIFFGDYASSFTSAYFSSLFYGWKRAEFSLLFPYHTSLLIPRSFELPFCSSVKFSSFCVLPSLFCQSDILTKIRTC